MIKIDETLISEDVFDVAFACDLAKCNGMCCVKGDGGAPLEESEVQILKDIYPTVKPYLTAEGIDVIEKKGTSMDEDGQMVTPLIDAQKHKPCVYVYYDNGIALCGIEKAYIDGKLDWQKPVSCHLYPIRVNKLGEYDAINYSKWSICKPACEKGKKTGIPVYKFVKDALIRKFGDEFYEKMEITDKLLKEKSI